MFVSYVRKLLSKNILIAFFIVDALGFILLGRQLPWYVFPLSLAIGFFIAGYLVFSDATREARLLQSAVPRLSVLFEGPSGYTRTVEAAIHTPLSEVDYDGELNNKRQELNAKWDAYTPPDVPAEDSVLTALTRPNRGAYESAVEAYLREYRSYITALIEFDKVDSSLRAFHLVITNESSVAAARLTLQIFVPEKSLLPTFDHMAWYYFDRTEMPEPPKEPDPAESALASFTGALASLRNIAGLSPLSENNEPTSEDIEGPIYDEEQQCITYRIAEIVPRFTDRDLPPFLLWLEGLSDGIDLALSTVLFGASIPTPIQDELILRVACSPRRDHSQVAA